MFAAVIYQNANRHLACQFTFACDGKRKVINERGAWARANRIARQTLDGKLYVPAVAKSTHYHAVYVHPYWMREMHKLARFGIHTFYRPIAWGNGSYEPVWGSRRWRNSRRRQQLNRTRINRVGELRLANVRSSVALKYCRAANAATCSRRHCAVGLKWKRPPRDLASGSRKPARNWLSSGLDRRRSWTSALSLRT